jgi:murein DD-endopeptidase MepM/ murein hydrolase activator NlpD
MTSSRREFLDLLIGAPLVAAGVCALTREARSLNRASTPRVTNYNDSGDYIITEGKTLLVGMTFPTPVRNLGGSLPTQIEPESAGGAQLSEPQPLFFYPATDEHTFRTILCAPLDVVEGMYKAHLTGQQEGSEARWAINYSARRGNYHETSLTVDKNFTEPSKEIAARMRHDFETMLEIYQRHTPRHWSEPFVQPVPGPDKDNFGDKRTYNRTKHSRHSGLDYSAKTGTPVRALNDGIVALSGEQWVSGQTICIDHGGGVFSKYLHLSERHVRENDAVKRGAVIGLSGHSGGQKPPPHLHLDLVINGVRVDPKDFMRTASQLLRLEAQDHAQRIP